MLKKIILPFKLGLFGSILVLLPKTIVYSQNYNNSSLILELGGISGLYSMNYNYQLPVKNMINSNFRIGIGGIKVNDIKFIGVPFNINLEYGLIKHFGITGFGFSYIYGLESAILSYDAEQVYYYTSGLYFNSHINYKYEIKGRFYVQIGIAPLIKLNEFNDFRGFVRDNFKYDPSINISREEYVDQLIDFFEYKEQKTFLRPSFSIGYIFGK